MRLTHWIRGAMLLGACGGRPEGAVRGQCDPARGPAFSRFDNVTGQSGISFEYVTDGFKGGALAVSDLDGDGLPEIVAGQRDGGVTLFHNLGDLRFGEVIGAGLDVSAGTTAIAAADLDNDGDRDLVLAGPSIAFVMANEGDGSFREAARLESSGTTEHVLPTDLDGDGRLDLYFSNYDPRTPASSQNRLYLNRSGLDLAFAGPIWSEAANAGERGLIGGGLSWTATAFDFDADGDQDLYVANDTLLPDFGFPVEHVTPPWPGDQLLRNDGIGADGVPIFTDLAPKLGLAKQRSSMGGVLADFDEDGRLDLYVPDFGAKKLFVPDAADGYLERAVELGVAATSRANAFCSPGSRDPDCLVLSWSAALGDFDLDGHDELLLVNGETSPGNTPPVVMLARGATLPYQEVSTELPCMDARGLVVTDLDGDGDQDLVIAHKNGPLEIYENRGRPVAPSWLHVTLRGRASNRDGVGAMVTMRLASGRSVSRVVGEGGVVHTARPPEAFFGLGDDAVEAVEVAWPSGRRTEVTRPARGTSIVMDEGL